MTPGFWDGREERELLRVCFADGRTLTGHYMSVVRKHFIVCHGPDMPLHGYAEGPLEEMAVLSVTVEQSRAEVLEAGRLRLLGEPLPGREPVTGEDYQHRLQTIARAVATATDWQREMQLRRQFDIVAARIGLAAGKRAWVLAEAKWSLRSNAPPTLSDLWADAVASPGCFARPRPQDFDPDPAVRRRRQGASMQAGVDPRSIRNMLSALRSQSLKVRVTRLGDPPEDRGHIQIDMPIKGRSRFVAIAERTGSGAIGWRLVWDGNDSKAGLRRRRQAEATPEYARLVTTLKVGRPVVQPDLFS